MNGFGDLSDLISFWRRHAYGLRTHIGISDFAISEAPEILKMALGEEWLWTVSTTRQKGNPLPLKSHPIGDLLAIPGRAQISELVELALYIRQMASVAGLSLALANLKAVYQSSLLQLAFAYRFMQMGATDMVLEPKAANGRLADFSFCLGTVPYSAECYIPDRPWKDTSLELQYTADKVFSYARSLNKSVRVLIRLNVVISASDRKCLQAALGDLIRDLPSGGSLSSRLEVASLTVDDITSMEEDTDFDRTTSVLRPLPPYDTADWGCNQFSVPESELGRVRINGQFNNGKPVNRMFVWRSPEENTPMDSQVYVSSIVARLKKKLPQTKTEEGNNQRVLVVDIPEARSSQGTVMQALAAAVEENILRKTSHVSGVLFVSRVFTSRNRHQYRGTIVPGRSVCSDFMSLLHNLNHAERDMVWLDTF